jgi:protein-S-isoprenylcysteine O-methyltransferase Ste14
MVKIGNFFFKNRNVIFMFFYLAIFIPFWKLFTVENNGVHYYWWPITIGLFITVSGQMIRGMTIGLAYIIRGGKDGKVYAEELVTRGIFNHCRNPLYVGNILMLAGVGVLSNSLLYVAVMLPAFIFIYQAIVLAEENFLRNKFGPSYDVYCKKVSRWFINPVGIGKTFASMKFNWRRYILKEYNTICVWLIGIVLILLFKYPELTDNDTNRRNLLAIIIVPAILVAYLITRYLKKSGTVKAE